MIDGGEYYRRLSSAHDDGTPIFRTGEDAAAEARIMERLSAVWRCEIHSFGVLAPIDWYATRAGRMVSVMEAKARSHPSSQYPTVFLNCRKWLALQLASAGFDIPAFFVVEFTDGIQWIALGDIDAARIRIAGCARRVKSSTDREPVIDVPVSGMARL